MSNSAAPAELARELEAAQKRVAELERALKKGGQRRSIALEAGKPGPGGENLNTGELVLQLFIEYTPAAIALFDREMKYLAASRRYLADYRLDQQNVVGRSHYEIFPEIPERWKEIHRRCLAGAVERAEADPFPRGDGTLDWVRWEIHPWFESDGEVGGIILFSEVITEREQAEDRYRKLIERLDLATRSARMGIWDWDIQKNELVWDDQMYTLYGLETGGFGGAYEAWLRGVHPEDRAASDEASARARRGEAEYDTEFRVVWPDGSIHWLKANGEVFRDQAGVPIRMIGVNYDISRRKQAEESLRQSEARYRLISENAADVIWVLNPGQGKFTYVSPSVEKLRGYTPEEVMAQPVEAALTPESLEQVRASLAVNLPAFLAKGSGTESFVNEVDQPRRDGSIVHTEVTTTYLFNERGQVEIVGVSRDITARKLLETRLTESERRYNLLFQKSTTPVVLLKMPEVVIADANEAAEKLAGFARQEMLGRTAAELGLISHEQRREAVAQYEQENRLAEHERRIFTKSGEERIVLTNTNPLELGGQSYAITSMQDITERKHMEDELRRSNAELEQFAYVASHDLQEPLRAVAGMVQLLQRKYKDQIDERANEYIEHAVEAASRMQGLINDLLSFSRVDRHGKPFQTVRVEESVQAALQNLEVAIQECGARVTWDDLPVVQADAMQLTQLFQNLIGNGIKFHGQAAPRVHISAAQTDNGWQFSVRDNGIGIDPQYFDRIFLVFQRLHTRRAYAGTGIGLALCRKIVERHGGQIWVESQPGLGSTFHFTLPQRNHHVLSF